MNGLYNMMVGGCNPDTDQLLSILGFKMSQVPRFRDCYLTPTDPPQIAVYTRMGGGNRGHWDFDVEKEAGPDCTCYGCKAKYVLAAHPLYLYDKDDDFDCTYATYFFKLPEGVDVSEIEAADLTPEDRMLAVIELLEAATKTKE